MRTLEENKKLYAKLLIGFGLNLQKGENLIINAPIESHDFVILLADAAYDAGVHEIFYRWESGKLEALKYKKGNKEIFGKYPDWMAEGYTHELKQNCAVLSLYMMDTSLLKDANPEYLKQDALAKARAFKEYKEYISDSKTNRLIASIPMEGWANTIYQNQNSEKNIEKLRNQIFSLVRIDQEDPFLARNEHLSRLKKYSEYLNTQQFIKLHYRSSKSDLTVELPKGHKRVSAGEKTETGIAFCPNMPTEEVFSMPHKYGVNGVIHSTFPLIYQGSLIKNFSLTFKDGEVVDFSAEEGYEILKSIIEADENSKRLGEVAIVPVNSPIYESGLIYYNTLFDENASCHFALGAAYPVNLVGSEIMNDQQKDQAGMNQSIMHVDFMVGDESLTITGETEDGEKIEFFVKGEWNII